MTRDLIARLEWLSGPDREVDEAIVEALGGYIRRVTNLGLNGRTPGSYRAFWPDRPDNNGRGSAVPYYTKTPESRARAVARLRALQQQEADRAE